MQFIQVGDDYINLATVELVTVQRDQQGKASFAEVHFAAGSTRQRRYQGEEAATLVAELEKARYA